jgi:adenylate kinase
VYIVLLGPPGSGKGTQGQILAKRFGLNHLSTGDLFRAILGDEDHPLYPKVQVVKEGKLVSDDVVNLVVEDALNKEEYESGVIFDGYPRTVAQAEALDDMLSSRERKVDMVIDFDVTEEVLLDRLLGRRVCSSCKGVFHKKQGYDKCPKCGGELITRDDDNEATIKERFEEYKNKTAPLQQYYKSGDSKYICIMVDDVDKTPDDIQKQIIDKI